MIGAIYFSEYQDNWTICHHAMSTSGESGGTQQTTDPGPAINAAYAMLADCTTILVESKAARIVLGAYSVLSCDPRVVCLAEALSPLFEFPRVDGEGVTLPDISTVGSFFVMGAKDGSDFMSPTDGARVMCAVYLCCLRSTAA